MKSSEANVLYYNFREGLASKAKLIPITTTIESLIRNKDKDYYESLFKYMDKHLQLLKEKGTLAGITDTIGDRLYFDFDCHGNLSAARADARITAQRLVEEYGFSEESINIYFTGGKGFALELMLNGSITPDQFKSITFKIAGDLGTFDQVVNDPNRIIRIVNTKHQSSGLFKILLSIEEFMNLSIDEILELAKEPRDNVKASVKVDLPDELKNISLKEKTENVLRELSFDVTSVDFSTKPRDLDKARWLLTNGFFKHGERNPAILCLAATYKNLGYSESVTKNLLIGVIQDQAARTGEDEFPEKELDLIIGQVYGPNWKGGQFTTRDENNWLYKYAVRMGVLEKEFSSPQTLDEVEDSFTSYVKNIENNTIKTGIDSLDRVIPITVGSNIGIVAGAGVGKTALSLKILKNNSLNDITTVFASLDMTRNRLFEKVVYNVTGLSRDDMYKEFREGRGAAITKKVKEQYGNVWFYDKSAATVKDIKDYVLSVEQKTGKKVKMVLLDYFERINCDVSDDTAASKKVANEIQDMLNDLNIACITLVQPNKFSLGAGPDTELTSYTSIKGSSFLYQSFRGIISLSRPFYTPSTKEHDKYMIINILKNDLGELGRFEYGWNGKRGEIYELEDIERQELRELLKMKNSSKEKGDWD